MSWSTPWAFLLFLPLLAVVAWTIYNRGKRRPSLQFSGVRYLQKAATSLRSRLIHVPSALKVLAFVLAIMALARPQESSTKVKKNVEGIDIIIALDVSDSMLIEDMLPVNRLEASKKTIREFIDQRTSDRIGLVVFSGESYTRVPLTLDYEMLRKSLQEVQTTRNLKMGTAIGVALANASGRLRNSTAKSRVVILLTDGENNSGTIDPDTALDIAKGYDLRIYTIGMGRDGQAQLPIIGRDAFGRKTKRYQPIHSKINEELLGNLATSTGGKFWRAVNSNALKEVFEEINRLEKTKIDITKYTRYTELFPPYLQIATILYLLSFVFAKTVLRRMP